VVGDEPAPAEPSVTPEAPVEASPVLPEADAELKVVYVDGGNVWLWTESGGNVQLTAGQPARDVRISDDGQVVAFMVGKSGDLYESIWAVNADGSNMRQVVSVDQLEAMTTVDGAVTVNAYQYAFVPGTHTLAFNTHPLFEGPGLLLQHDMRLVDLNTDTLTTLFDVNQGGTFYYSPDGSQIALVTPTTISLVNADGSNLRANVLVYDNVITYSEYEYHAQPVWAADGSYLRVVIPSPDMLAEDSTFTVWQIPTDGSTASSVATYAALSPLFFSGKSLSPDLNKVVYYQRHGEPTDNLFDLRVAQMDTGADDLYVTLTQMDFSGWAPSSLLFLYREDGEMMRGHVEAMASPFTDVPNVIGVEWIDDNHFVFSAGDRGGWQLRISELAHASTLIANPAGDYVSFAIAP
ncbi:MAG: hypothetical protein JXB38_05265, partial [Anaerolineales bacterium]|nr:hypothetical protein [Anaerolineales bacterium]